MTIFKAPELFTFFQIYFMCMGALPIGMPVYHNVPGTCRGQQRALGPLELELQMLVSHLEGC